MIAPLAPRMVAQDSPLVGQVRELARTATAQGIADALRGMALRPDSTPDLPRWRARTLVVCGEQDQLIPRAACDSLARNVPGGRQAIVSGAGHLAFLERPDDVMAELRWLLGA